MPKKSVTNKIWSSLISKFALMAGIFALCYIIAGSMNVLPQSVKDLVSFLAANFQLLAFLACFFFGAYISLQFLQTRKRGPSQ
jgi:hypothetical protein